MRRVLAYAGMAVVAAAAAWNSFEALTGLGRLAGIHPGWMLPLSIDAYALTATEVWTRPSVSARVRRWAACNAVAALVVSIAGNAAYHGLTATGVDWVVPVLVAAVAPAALFLVVHLWSRVSNDLVPGPEPAKAHEPTPAPASTAAPVRTRQPTRTRAPGSTTEQARDYARTRHQAGDPVKAPDLTRQFPALDPSRARRIVRELAASSNGHGHG